MPHVHSLPVGILEQYALTPTCCLNDILYVPRSPGQLFADYSFRDMTFNPPVGAPTSKKRVSANVCFRLIYLKDTCAFSLAQNKYWSCVFHL